MLDADTGDASLHILRMKHVRDRVALSESTIFRMVADGQFPKPFSLVPGGRAVGWLSSEVDAWIMARVMDDAEYHEEVRAGDDTAGRLVPTRVSD